MTESERNLLYFLRCALWDRQPKDEELVGKPDYAAIYNLAVRQSVHGLVAKSLDQRLEFIDSPQTETLIHQCLTAMMTAALNSKDLDDTVVAVVRALHEEDLEPVLVKGQAVARYYAFPQLRVTGDIDLFLGMENALKAKKILIDSGMGEDADEEKGNPKHCIVRVNNIDVELHLYLCNKDEGSMAGILNQWLAEQMAPDETRSVTIDGENVPIPSALGDAVFVFYHIWSHLMAEGVGLRQVCDLACLLNAIGENLDRAQLKDILQRIGLLREWRIFAALMIDWLGLPQEKAPLYEGGYHWQARKLLKTILWFGNFGKEISAHFDANLDRDCWILHKTYTLWHFINLWSRTFVVSPRVIMTRALKMFRVRALSR